MEDVNILATCVGILGAVPSTALVDGLHEVEWRLAVLRYGTTLLQVIV